MSGGRVSHCTIRSVKEDSIFSFQHHTLRQEKNSIGLTIVANAKMASQNDFEFQRFKTEMGVSVIKQIVSLEIGN